MKFHLSSWLIAAASFSSFHPTSVDAAVAGIRGKDKQQRRVLQGNRPAKYLVQDIQYEHNESGRRLKQDQPHKIDTVELENGLIYTVEGKVPHGWTVSGQDIKLPTGTVINDDTATIILPNAAGNGRLLEGEGDAVPKVESALTKEQQRNLSELNRQRQLAQVTGDKSVLAVKIVLSDGQYGFDDSYLECKVFGTSNGSNCGDTYHLANAYRDCSYNKLRFNKAADKTSGNGNVSNISNGVVTVTLPTTSTSQGDGTVRNAVTSALNTAFGSATSLADHLMYCLPPNTMSGIAYAYINSWNSVYSNNWCNSVSAQLHEIGHNIGLAHSNEGTTAYADQSGMMGYSYSGESTPRMCFNAAKNYQLGWYSDKTKVISPGASTDNCFAGDLYGTAFYADAGAQTVGIKVNTDSSTDVYIMYNAKTGIQSGTVEGGNQVMVVTTGAEGTGYSESTLVQKITTNTAGYSLPGFSNTVLYVDSNTSGSHASIRIETDGQACVVGPTSNPTPAPPTPAPTQQPTAQPTEPQPTPNPTPQPTSAPTAPIDCTALTAKSGCDAHPGICNWTGKNWKSGQCVSTAPTTPSPTPPPTPPSPTTPSPTPSSPG
ncbi:hypothetical protein ACHAWC_008828, partial [Mediolabrus comicus]